MISDDEYENDMQAPDAAGMAALRVRELCDLTDILPAAAMVIRHSGRGVAAIAHVNDGLCRLVALPMKEIVGSAIRGPLGASAASCIEDIIGNARRAPPATGRPADSACGRGTTTITTPAGAAALPVDVTMRPFHMASDDRPSHFLCLVRPHSGVFDDLQADTLAAVSGATADHAETGGRPFAIPSAASGLEAIGRFLPGLFFQRGDRAAADTVPAWHADFARDIGLGASVVRPRADVILRYIHPGDRSRVAVILGDAATLQTACRVTWRTDPERYPVRWMTSVVSPSFDRDGVSWEIVSRDVTDSRNEARPPDSTVSRDPLTGLVNRQVFTDVLTRIVQRCHDGFRTGAASWISLHLIDLDDFRDVNQALGYEAGDEIIRILGSRLADAAEGRGIVARLGDDEFAVVLQHEPGQHKPGDDDAAISSIARTMAERFAAAVSRPVEHAVGNWVVWGSQGVAVFEPGSEPGSSGFSAVAGASCSGAAEASRRMMVNAHSALRYSKFERRRGFAIYSETLMAVPKQRMVIRQAMETALENAEFELYFQPKIDIRNTTIIGAEALLRWFSPDIGRQMPAFFIPIAETTGMIVPIGRWILQEACRCRASWGGRVSDDMAVAVNVSGIQLRDPRFVETVTEALAVTGIKAHQLELELTEGLLILASSTAREVLERLRRLGVRVVIDDFGSGYASFGYLKDFQVDGIKIDRGFIQTMALDKVGAAVTRAILSIGGALDMEVVAEGVETEVERRLLLEEGCTVAQGYLFSPPVPKKKFLSLLDTGVDASPAT